MRVKKATNLFLIKELVIYLFVVFLGLLFIKFTWQTTEKQEKDRVLQIAVSIEASIPKEELKQLGEQPEDISKNSYPQLRGTLQNVIQVTKNARFAYLYVERNNKLYFIVDSEPETSPDNSPPGQEFTEADPIDKNPFKNGQAQVTNQVTDRWGNWVSAEVPITDTKTGKVIAVFGMDYNANSWRNRIWFEVSQSIIMVLVILFLLILSRRSALKNLLLKKEIEQRENAEKELQESESYFRLLFELNPQPIIVYDLDSMKIMAVNNSSIELYRYQREEFLSMTIIDLKAPKEFTRLWKNLLVDPNSFQKTEIWNHKTKDSRIIQVEVHSHNLDFRHKNARLVLLIDVTEKIRTEKNLRENQLTHSNLVSNLPGLVYRCAMDENYTMEFMSEASLNITGYSPDDFIGNKNISFNDLILAEYRNPIREKWKKTLEERSVFKAEYPIQTVSGEIKWVWERGKGIFDENGELKYLEGYIEDITSRKLAEKELRKLSQAIEQNPVSVIITDPNGVIEYTNPKFTEMTGFDASEVIGQNPRTFKSNLVQPEIYINLWEVITSGNVWNGELINKTKSGELYWANNSISPIFDEQGRIINFVAIVENISDKKKSEEELIRAKDKAEESDRLKTAFLANISHEIRTPMNGILGFAELLKEPDLNSENKIEFLESIEKSGQRMLNIIDNLMDMSKIEAGEITIWMRRTNINKTLQELHLFFKNTETKKNIDIDFHCDLPEEESFIETDATKLNQVLTNLVNNALKFTEKGSINFGYIRKESMFEFFVSDTGPGISPDHKDLIFERFRQGSLNLNREYEGAGLGLAIAKAYVELLEGTIWIESELGKGSTFYFTLPYKKNHPKLEWD